MLTPFWPNHGVLSGPIDILRTKQGHLLTSRKTVEAINRQCWGPQSRNSCIPSGLVEHMFCRTCVWSGVAPSDDVGGWVGGSVVLRKWTCGRWASCCSNSSWGPGLREFKVMRRGEVLRTTKEYRRIYYFSGFKRGAMVARVLETRLGERRSGLEFQLS